MTNVQPLIEDMGHDVYLIDLLEQGMPYRTAAYLIRDDQPTLIETGAANSHDTLVAGLQKLGLHPRDLAYVVVTHVHLDHAGGAGQMMALADNAQLVVHPRGARHMADPSRLWQGAGQVYGERLEALFGPVVPVRPEQILVRNHEDTLSIGSRTLTFFDSPGHAKHHFTILDPVSDALFAGDAVGIRYRREFTGWDEEWVIPSTSPVDFDPAAVHRTLDMLEAIPFSTVYHAHHGRSPKEEAIRATRRGADEMAALIERVYHEGVSVQEVMGALQDWVVDHVRRIGIQPGADLSPLQVDMFVDALGLMHYESTRRKRAAENG
ncbi:MBL fold metallo-hydrolase [Alicyclobacillus contaminans]|uniref:MBL fold metallo-hydrolase n=1 Tax=Alicyclobacillus contaminans TaxID=392016 RepID=UPI00054FDFF9|nr:MBL fold metallo-hydrolase [Alicyclobacillus contaminans]